MSKFEFNPLNNVMGAEEAAKLWGLSPSYVKDLCAKGKIDCLKVGKTWVINKAQPSPSKNVPPPRQTKADLDQLYTCAIKMIDHLEQTIKDASVYLIDRSEKEQLTYSEMKELYEMLVDSIGFNDGEYFNKLS